MLNKIQIILSITLSIFYFISYSQPNSYVDTLINNEHYKIIKRYDNGIAKKVCRFKMKNNADFNYKYKSIPDSLLDFSIKQGVFIKFNHKGCETRQGWYQENKQKNKKFIGLKFGRWYGDYWQCYYIFGFSIKCHHSDYRFL